MIGRDPSTNFAALAAEEARRRAEEEAANEPHPAAADVEWDRPDRDQPPTRTRKIFGRIRRALGR
jgi:hypothetical protein